MGYFLNWDKEGERLYETGIDRGVLYVYDNEKRIYKPGVGWNGLISVDESPSGAEPTILWADNIKYVTVRSREEFNFTINAYQSPEEFDICDGMYSPTKGVRVTQQNRAKFGFSYRTLIGNDIQNNDYGYALHFVYGASCSPSDKDRGTISDSPSAVEFSWECTSEEVEIGQGFKPTSHVIVRSTDFITPDDKEVLKKFEEIVYGRCDDAENYIPVIFNDDTKYYPYRYYIKYTLGGFSYYQVIKSDDPPSNWGAPNTFYTREMTLPRLPSPAEIMAFFNTQFAPIFTTRDGIAFFTNDNTAYCVYE